MTITEWVKQLDSHNIYSHDELAADFKKETGHDPCWQYYLAYEAGNGFDRRLATLNEGVDLNEKLIGGFEIAEAIAEKYASHTKSFKILGQLSGRGSRHEIAVKALEEAHI